MRHRPSALAIALLLAAGVATPTRAADTPQPVRMGCGLMTFDTVPGWGLGPDGKSVRGFLGDKHSDIHDMKIRQEDGGEFIYGARNANAEGIKFDSHSGEIVLKLPFPEESGLKLKQFNPTAITVAPNGDIFLSDGYASNHIFKFDRAGKYLMHFETKGNGLKEFGSRSLIGDR